MGVQNQGLAHYFKEKQLENGDTLLVARGFQYVDGVDYNEALAPVVRFSSICYLLPIEAPLNLGLHQMPVVTAFLHGYGGENI